VLLLPEIEEGDFDLAGICAEWLESEAGDWNAAPSSLPGFSTTTTTTTEPSPQPASTFSDVTASTTTAMPPQGRVAG